MRVKPRDPSLELPWGFRSKSRSSSSNCIEEGRHYCLLFCHKCKLNYSAVEVVAIFECFGVIDLIKHVLVISA